MSRLSSNVLSASLIGAGALAWTMNSRPLAGEPSMLIPSNPLGVKMSPYGEVFAMAMQGPIDLYWHAGADHGADHEHGENCDHDHKVDHGICEGGAGGDCPSGETSKLHDQVVKKSSSYRDLLNELNEVASTRTNPKAATEKHLFHMRRQIENKLRFAYELDPSHYGNYNSYHFFLTEPQLGTRPELTPGAAKLADSTIDYCLRRNDDPRPALTAAAAAENELELMFNEPARFTKEQMRNRLAIVDFSLARHQQISKQWLENGNWELISPMRQEEIVNRFKFLSRVRDAAEGTILRLEGQPNLGQASN
jgi:hypothetical protein